MMQKLRFIVLLLILIPGASQAQEIIQGRYCYTYGEDESREAAGELTRTLAIHNAIRSYPKFAETLSGVAIVSSAIIKLVKLS